MYTIVGSGFGLYGYLPALVLHLKKPVTLQKKYISVLESRDDIRCLLDQVNWVPSLDEALAVSENLIIALPPLQQSAFLSDLTKIKTIKNIILEKPIATQPTDANHIIRRLLDADKRVRVGFSFLFTEWYSRLREAVKGLDVNARITVKWSFQADHFKRNIDTWKRYHSSGGGVLRFYGIHLISVIADLGFNDALYSRLFFLEKDQPHLWESSLVCGGRSWDILVDSNASHNSFQVCAITNQAEEVIVDLVDPFIETQEKSKGKDRRVPVLAEIVESFQKEDAYYHSLYHQICRIWLMLEDNTTIF